MFRPAQWLVQLLLERMAGLAQSTPNSCCRIKGTAYSQFMLCIVFRHGKKFSSDLLLHCFSPAAYALMLLLQPLPAAVSTALQFSARVLF
ncbi:hypothetical protein IEQ34_018269 [Dendrobium chrysotoxum]|uniref:Secreted protein n=1 Tax=Dendrobium chrysotoxum TaxID=161865 RepID=A0AAV7FW27_DENCH|nr:hypothetical protein IEQ34_018269 [Dendrobium chrysotoxum]